MPRSPRAWIHPEKGCYHIISRTAGAAIWLTDSEKEYLMILLQHFASGFYVTIHTFCIMSNHFHILLSGREEEAAAADERELLRRYRHLYGQDADPPVGSARSDGEVEVDEDGGLNRLRCRLGSVSRFVQELKQRFSCWYNRCHERHGYLWGERFKSVLVDRGDAELLCSAYIDLNPVRGGVVKKPEDYRWSGLGMRVRGGGEELDGVYESYFGDEDVDVLGCYRCFLYESGGVKVAGKSKIESDVVEKVRAVHGGLGIGDRLGYRLRNISEGIGIGSAGFIEEIQRQSKRKYVRGRRYGRSVLYVTRVLRL